MQLILLRRLKIIEEGIKYTAFPSPFPYHVLNSPLPSAEYSYLKMIINNIWKYSESTFVADLPAWGYYSN